MYYFKYLTETDTNGIMIKLNPLVYKDHIVEILVGSDFKSSKKQYVVKVDLSEDDLINFAKQQRVTLESITEEEFNHWKTTSTVYQTEWELNKASRDQELENATVVYINIVYDADDRSISRMGDIITSYNFKFIQSMASKEVNTVNVRKANEVYDETIEWKNNAGTYINLTIKELKAIYDLAIKNRERIWRKWTPAL